MSGRRHQFRRQTFPVVSNPDSAGYYDGENWGGQHRTDGAVPDRRHRGTSINGYTLLLAGDGEAVNATLLTNRWTLAADGTLTFEEPDADDDGVGDAIDNCTLVANADQLDADNDGYGNICDGVLQQRLA
jgi:hypothetical protein